MELSDHIRDIGIKIGFAINSHPKPGINEKALDEIEGLVDILRGASGYTDEDCDQLIAEARIYYGPAPLPSGPKSAEDRFLSLRQLAVSIQGTSHVLRRKGL